ncbi:MAG TPA: Gfo/Idh/MocA family oxidoreductase [Bryobacteraceae bacterium]|nr:Gfo/Idh/MocA family oxidoreductase [Bryobacteraceae bacterium]
MLNDGFFPSRRDFMTSATGIGATLGLAGRAVAARPGQTMTGRVLGANDRINVAAIGVGGRGTYVAHKFAEIGQANNSCQIVAVCDVYQKRVNQNKERHQCDGYLDYREVLNRSDVDAVIVATPDHWHARIALDAIAKGKDVYLEKPMCHTIEQARELVKTVDETRRVVQIGSQTCSADHWWKTRKLIAEGAIGQMLMSQGSYHRNSVKNWLNGDWKIDSDASPSGKGENYVDWQTWLGSAPKRPWNADRFFRYRKYWDYSGGIATDLFFHVSAPLNICWGEAQFPSKVVAGGTSFLFPDGDVPAEVPENFHLIAEYPKGHAMVLSSSMANSQHIPGMIRGHAGTIVMVEGGGFENGNDHILLRPEKQVIDEAYKAKFGDAEKRFELNPKNEEEDWMFTHITNFLDCMRSRQTPTLDVATAARTQVLVSMAVQSYRQGRALFFDEKTWKVSTAG